MKKVIVGILLGALAMYAWQRGGLRQSTPDAAPASVRTGDQPVERTEAAQDSAPPFVCDGRTHCSQMTSCDEAKFFLRNCPGPEMDGDDDGIPCEKQWCKSWL